MKVGVMTRISEHLQTRGVPFAPVAHQQAYTSIAETRALGIDASVRGAMKVVCGIFCGPRERAGLAS
jgi:hypothetical protein